MKLLTQKKIVIAASILCLLFPMGGTALGSQSGYIPSPRINSGMKEVVALRVHVVAEKKNETSSFPLAVSTTAVGKTCFGYSEKSDYVAIQNPVDINLNQPSNCFSLRIGSVIAVREISVLPLQTPTQTIVVVTLPSSTVSTANILPQGPEGRFNFAVLVLSVAVHTMYELGKKKMRKINIGMPQLYPYRLSLAQLSMLRC